MKIVKLKTLLLLTMILIFSTSISYADSAGEVQKLTQKCSQIDFELLNQEVSSIYNDTVAGIIIGDKIDMLQSNISDDEIKSATLSNPLPVFSSKTKYNKGDDYKSKLELMGWNVVVQINGNPIAVFTVASENGEYMFNNVFSEEYAINYVNALNQLSGSNKVILPAGGYFFLADDTDTVMLVQPMKHDTGEQYPSRSFTKLNAAVNVSIDYYSNIKPEDLAYGSNEVLLKALYGNDTSETNQWEIATYISIGFGLGLLALVLFEMKRKKFKRGVCRNIRM